MLLWHCSNARCGLPRSSAVWLLWAFDRDWLLCFWKGFRLSYHIESSLCKGANSLPDIVNNNLLLEHHRRIHWKTLNVESWVVSGRIHTDVV